MTGPSHEERVPTDIAILDIGDDAGALLVKADRSLLGCEIHVTRPSQTRSFAHAVVHRRDVGGQWDYSALFPALAPGTYTLVLPEGQGPQVDVVAGSVAVVATSPFDRSVMLSAMDPPP